MFIKTSPKLLHLRRPIHYDGDRGRAVPSHRRTHQETLATGRRRVTNRLEQLIHFSPSLRLHYGSPLALNSILVVWRRSAARSPHPQTPNRSDKPASKSSPFS